MRNGPDKNPFRGVSDLLFRASPAKRILHFLSYIIDLVLVFIVSYLLFLGGHSIVTNSKGYKSNYSNYINEITYYQDMLVDAHVAEYLDKDNQLLVDDEDLTVKIAISQILKSYTKDNFESPEFLENPETKLRETYVGAFYEDAFTPIAYENDYVSLFFTDYVPLHNENEELVKFNGATEKHYVVEFYKKYLGKYGNIGFLFTENDDAIPCLKPSVANNIYKFLVRADGFSRDAYDSFVEYYSAMLQKCEDILFNAPSYQQTHYQDYLRYRKNVTKAVDSVLILSIFLAYFPVVLLPMLIFKDGRSLGKIFLRIATINTDKSETEIWKWLIRSVLGALSGLFLAFFIVLLPPFNGLSSLMYLPFISIGSLDITLLTLVIISFVLVSLNGIFVLLSHEKRSFTDFIFQTITVDVTMLDEPDYDEKNETHL